MTKLAVPDVLSPNRPGAQAPPIVEGYRKKVVHIYETRSANHVMNLEFESIEGQDSGILNITVTPAYSKEAPMAISMKLNRSQLESVIFTLTKGLDDKNVDRMEEIL